MEEYLDKIKKGAVFIYPTDTIYGIGCDATNEEAVKKIRDLKDRPDRPFSVIAPNKEWILEHCKPEEKVVGEERIQKLPGPYTLVMHLKTETLIAPSCNNSLKTLGVRIPRHWFSRMVKELDLPLVTTSANKINQDFMASLEDLDPDIKAKVDFIVYEDEIKGRPSKIVCLDKQLEIKER